MEPSGVRNAASPVPEVPSGRPLHTHPGLARCVPSSLRPSWDPVLFSH